MIPKIEQKFNVVIHGKVTETIDKVTARKIYQTDKHNPLIFQLSNTERDVKTTITLEVKKLILYYFIDVGGREIV